MHASVLKPLAALTIALLAFSPQLRSAIPSEQDLIAILESGASLKEKNDACRQLAIAGGPKAVPALAALLNDDQLTHMARFALEPNPSPAASQALRDALPSLSTANLRGAVASLGARQDPNAVPLLTPLLRHADPAVAQTAARALGQIGTPAAAATLQSNLAAVPDAVRSAIVEGLFRIADAARADDHAERAAPIYRLLLAQPAPPHLRAGALEGALLTADTDAPELLAQHLSSSTEDALFAAAIRAALQLPAATAPLLDSMNRLPPPRQILVLQALAARRDPAAVPPILSNLNRAPKDLLLTAIRALGEINDPSAGPALLHLALDSDRETAEAAFECFASLPGSSIDQSVLQLLDSGSSSQQTLALELISRRRMTEAVPMLRKLASQSQPLQPSALRKLGELAGPEEFTFLLKTVGQLRDDPALAAAEEALVALAGKSDAPAQNSALLAAALKDAATPQRLLLIRVLASISDSIALQAIQEQLPGAAPQVRSAAYRAFSNWKSSEAAPTLLALAQSAATPTERLLALRGYLRLAVQSGAPPAEQIARCQKAAALVQRAEEKKLLLSTAAQIASPEAAALITPHLADPEVKNEAVAALVAVADKALKGSLSPEQAAQLGAALKTAAAAADDDSPSAATVTSLLKKAEEKSR